MSLHSDYEELPLHLEDLHDGETVKIYAHLTDQSLLTFHGVHTDPIRFNGHWLISHMFQGESATSYLPADDVRYFTVVHPWDNRPADWEPGTDGT